MTISSAYLLYPITQTLKEHMIRAASVADVIMQNLRKLHIDREIILQTILLHDTGNLIKFDLEKFPNLLGSQINERDYWKKTQSEFIKRFGKDEHAATERIAKELGVSQKVMTLLKHMIFDELQDTANGNNWNLKICNYSDLRSGPFNVMSVNDRFDDLINRYKGRNHKISNVERTEKNRNYCLMIEQQLQAYCSLDLESIDETLVKPSFKKLESYNLSFPLSE